MSADARGGAASRHRLSLTVAAVVRTCLAILPWTSSFGPLNGAGPDLPSDVTEGLLGLPADAVGPVPLEALVFAQKALAHRLERFPLGGP